MHGAVQCCTVVPPSGEFLWESLAPPLLSGVSGHVDELTVHCVSLIISIQLILSILNFSLPEILSYLNNIEAGNVCNRWYHVSSPEIC